MKLFVLLMFFWGPLSESLAMDPLVKDLLTPIPDLGERCGYDSCFPVREGWINVHVVPHTHAELGYMKTFDDYYTGHDDLYAANVINMKRVFDATISELWADKFRKFTISDSELPYFFHWWRRRDGTVRRMVYELIRQGRLVIVGGGWGMNDEASTSYQSIIDSYTYSLRKINATFLSCGRPRVAWQADTFGHSREYASLVAQMGFDALFINPISFDDELIRMERKALEFVWRGSDDLGQETDIYTHKLFDGYWSPPGFCFGSMCGDPLLISSDTLFKNIDERIELFVELIRHRQSPYYNTKHVMVMMGQRMGYFDAKLWFANIDKLITNFNIRTYKSGEKMHAIYSNPVCYLRAVYEDNPILETKQDDFFPFAYNKHSYTTGAFTSRPTFKYMVRESNIFLQVAKQLQVLLNLGNNDELFEDFNWIMGVAQDHNIISGAMRPYAWSYYTEKIHTAMQWANLLLGEACVAQDHNIISGAMRPYAWSYYTEKIHTAMQWANLLLGEAFNKIRGSGPTTEYRICKFNISSCPNTYMDKFYITLYNPLAWQVTMPVRLPIRNIKYEVFNPEGLKVKAIIANIPNHIYKIPNREPAVTSELVFIAHDIPPLGLRSYFIEKENNRRTKKSLIKKISKKQKYFIRQATKENNSHNEENQEYYDFDESKLDTKIEFGNVGKNEDVADYYVVTPKYKDTTADKILNELDIPNVTTDNRTTVKLLNESGIRPNLTTGYSKDEMDAVQTKIKDEMDAVQTITKDEMDAVQTITKDEMDAVQTKTKDEMDAVQTITKDKMDAVQTINKDEMDALQTKTKDEMDAVQTITKDKMDAVQTINKDEMDALQTKIKDEMDAVQTKTKDEMDGVQTITETIISNIQDETTTVKTTTELINDTEKTTKSNLIASKLAVNATESSTQFKTWIDENATEIDDEDITDVNEIDYYSKESKDDFIKNKYIQINLDEHRKVTSMNLSNGVNTSLDIQYHYYVSDEPETMNSTKRNPGAYIFRPVDTNPEAIIDVIDTKVYKSDLVEEIHTKYSDYASFVVKLYVERPVVEVDWVIGPIPTDDGFGKEVFLRYTTDLVNDGVFYTDANMRQMMKRIRNVRATYEPYNLDPIAGNFYPVTSRIYIEDLKRNLRFSVFNDRSQGGTSLLEGSIDLMVHRRIFTDDSGVQTFLNETENGVGITVRGTHYIYLTKADSKQNRVFEKKFAKEIELKPQVRVNKIAQAVTKEDWIDLDNEFTALKTKLPIGIHLLTIQEWNDKSLLLRLENYLEKVDVVRSGIKRVFLKDLFVNIKPVSVVETTLSGNILLKDHVPLQWRKNGSFVKNFNEYYGPSGKVEYAVDEIKVVPNVDLYKGITLVPQQIRTLVVQYEYVKDND